jgi:hypothetical protein
MFMGEKVAFAERGRRPLGTSCYVYFEVMSALPHVTSVEIFALDERGVVLGKGHSYQSEGFRHGFLFEVFFSSAPADLIVRWQFQERSWGSGSPRTFSVQMLNREQWEREGARVDYVRAPASLVAVTNQLPKLKHGWTGPVVGSARSEFFHHPECRKAKAMRETYRRDYPGPQPAWDEGLNPCSDCLSCLP